MPRSSRPMGGRRPPPPSSGSSTGSGGSGNSNRRSLYNPQIPSASSDSADSISTIEQQQRQSLTAIPEPHLAVLSPRDRNDPLVLEQERRIGRPTGIGGGQPIVVGRRQHSYDSSGDYSNDDNNTTIGIFSTSQQRQISMNERMRLVATYPMDIMDEIRDPRFDRNQFIQKSCLRGLCGMSILFILLALILVIISNHTSSTATTVVVVLPTPPDNLQSDVCNAELVSQYEAQRLICEQACEVADCCDFSTDLPLSCLAGNEDTCQVYMDACAVLDN